MIVDAYYRPALDRAAFRLMSESEKYGAYASAYRMLAIWEQRCHEEEANATQHYRDLMDLRSSSSGVKYIPHFDAYKLYCEAFKEVYGPNVQLAISPNALQLMADKLVVAQQSEGTSAHSEAVQGRAATGLVSEQRPAAVAAAPSK